MSERCPYFLHDSHGDFDICDASRPGSSVACPFNGNYCRECARIVDMRSDSRGPDIIKNMKTNTIFYKVQLKQSRNWADVALTKNFSTRTSSLKVAERVYRKMTECFKDSVFRLIKYQEPDVLMCSSQKKPKRTRN